LFFNFCGVVVVVFVVLVFLGGILNRVCAQRRRSFSHTKHKTNQTNKLEKTKNSLPTLSLTAAR
jgi:hypothetical protein